MSRTITIRLNDDLYDELVLAAEQDHRSLNNLINLRLGGAMAVAVSDEVLPPAKPVKKPAKRATKKVGGFATFSTPTAAAPPQTASEEEIEAYLDDARQAAKNGLSVEEYREILLNADPAGHVWGS